MDSTEVKKILRQIGLKPSRAAGQNFLIDQAPLTAMIDTADIQPGDAVLEIGPGLGVLTEQLLAAGAEVTAVELDQRLFSYLKKRFAHQTKLQLIHNDIFKVRLDQIFSDGAYKLVANLPYSSTSLIFRNFLSLSPRPISLTTMIQREVAKRLTADVGKMSLLSVTAQYYSHIDFITDVPRTAFWPSPEVDSAIIHCQVKPWPDENEAKKFLRVVRAGFSSRRKQLKNSLAAGLQIPVTEVEKVMNMLVLKPSLRAQDLRVEDWLKLAKNLN